jgi:PKD repeat protein
VSRPAARFVVLTLVVMAAACDKVALLAPTGSTVTLSISSTSVGGNGTAQVVATVIEAGGTPVHNGTEVTFQTSVGAVEPAVVRTENGLARTTFRANGASGTARLIALSGGARSEPVEVRVGSAAAETVTVRATPSTVPQGGGPIQVTATVRDTSGNPLPGAQVVFSADNGTLSSNSAVTDTSGEAAVNLTTTRQTVVRASVAGKEGQATINVASFPTATLTLNPTTPVAGQTVQLTVTPSVPSGSSPVQSIVVDFGDGTTRTLSGNGGTLAHTYTRSGSYTITATMVDAAGGRTQANSVVVVQAAVVGVSIAAPATNPTVGTPTTFTVNITNPNNVPISQVRFNFGDGTSSTQTVSGNTATTQKTYQASGTFTVTATAIDASGNQYSGSTQVTVNPRPAVQVTLDAQPSRPGVQWSCSPASTYPKTCTTRFSSWTAENSPSVSPIFTAGLSGSGFASAASYQWNFGDGTSETTSSSSVDHAYFVPGTYTVTVRVTTTDGNSGEQRLTLVITP